MTINGKKSNPARHFIRISAEANIGAPFHGEETKRGDYIFINRLGMDTGEWMTCDKTPENYMALMAASKRLLAIRNTMDMEQEARNAHLKRPYEALCRRTDDGFIS